MFKSVKMTNFKIAALFAMLVILSFCLGVPSLAQQMPHNEGVILIRKSDAHHYALADRHTLSTKDTQQHDQLPRDIEGIDLTISHNSCRDW